MMEHLSSRRIAEWMVGNRTAEEELHVSVCLKCRRELEWLNGSVSLFAASMRGWSEQQRSDTAPSSSPVNRSHRAISHPLGNHPLRWATAAASLLMLISGAVYQHRAAEDRRAAAARADAVLMEQVDTEVSQSVPSTLEPLERLMDVDTDTVQQSPATSNKTRNDNGATP